MPPRASRRAAGPVLAEQIPISWENIPTEYSIKDIGAPLLASLAEGLYTPEEVLREYVQNAIDSYADFRRVTGLQPANTVQILIVPRTAEVHIMDRGLGMDRDDVERAKAIAVSPKLQRPNDFIGFRGIGIWSGLSACDTLILETTKRGVAFRFRLTMDFKSIRERLYDPIPIDDLLRGKIVIEAQPADAEEHYTRVQLSNVERARYGALLDVTRMTRYVEQNLPVPLDPEWAYTPRLEAGLKDVPWTSSYELTINGEPVYRHFPGATEIKEPSVEVIADGDQVFAYAWVAETARTGASKRIEADTENGEVTNFALRIKNFTVGDRGAYSRHEDVLDAENLSWFVGEVYVVDPDIKPDTNRRSIQRSFRSDRFIELLRLFYSQTATRSRGWSAEVNAVAASNTATATVEEIETLLAQTGVQNGEETQRDATELLKGLEREREIIRTALEKITAQDTGDESLRVRAERRYLRKAAVKAALETSSGRIAALLNRISTAFPELTALRGGDTQKPKKRRSSRARTATSGGRQVSTQAALGTQAVAGDQSRSGDGGGVPAAASVLELAIAAFYAALAAVVGEGSEAYRQVEERLPAELRRRGLEV
jgi:hypothetical protein